MPRRSLRRDVDMHAPITPELRERATRLLLEATDGDPWVVYDPDGRDSGSWGNYGIDNPNLRTSPVLCRGGIPSERVAQFIADCPELITRYELKVKELESSAVSEEEILTTRRAEVAELARALGMMDPDNPGWSMKDILRRIAVIRGDVRLT